MKLTGTGSHRYTKVSVKLASLVKVAESLLAVDTFSIDCYSYRSPCQGQEVRIVNSSVDNLVVSTRHTAIEIQWKQHVKGIIKFNRAHCIPERSEQTSFERMFPLDERYPIANDQRDYIANQTNVRSFCTLSCFSRESEASRATR